MRPQHLASQPLAFQWFPVFPPCREPCLIRYLLLGTSWSALPLLEVSKCLPFPESANTARLLRPDIQQNNDRGPQLMSDFLSFTLYPQCGYQGRRFFLQQLLVPRPLPAGTMVSYQGSPSFLLCSLTKCCSSESDHTVSICSQAAVASCHTGDKSKALSTIWLLPTLQTQDEIPLPWLAVLPSYVCFSDVPSFCLAREQRTSRALTRRAHGPRRL